MEAMIIDVTQENFNEMVVNNSMHVPVLVDFWAPWCGPCKQVMPMLEKLAKDLAGQFILAKINTEEQEELANHFQIRSIPSFKIFHQGHVVEELQGGQPLSAFQEALKPYLKPDESEDLRAQAQQAFAEGDYDRAMQLLGQASQANPNNYRIHLDLAKMYFQRGHVDEAKQLLEKLPDEAKESDEGKSLLALFKFSQMVAEAPDIETVQKNLQANPNDPEALYHLAGYLMLHQQVEEAMNCLLKLFTVDRDFRDGIAKTTLLEIFDLLHQEHPQLVNAYRRKLQNLLF
ncbi:tetratricopeptide repeat protein [Thiomicrospira sp. S5]|uniref:tetratricopeptide repeat protein n=1 Tax=Thiomicrospira sp. S5 TaxID=1803865 RepID=UPI000F8A1EB0|nr:tetratricopeptide repeat protein [Thiomicrospira sp. S5]AZR81764.1 thioredoxin [Thiomicrospira sp. S5]